MTGVPRVNSVASYKHRRCCDCICYFGIPHQKQQNTQHPNATPTRERATQTTPADAR